ncbi:VOC family protein [Candidatus Berkelbacteria bacterium]|nr:VOC family protein [Candidatus Berkelbacteria bacterium]
MDSIVHFEIPVNVPKEAKKFYNEVFGWNISQWGQQEYWMAVTTEVDEQSQRPKNPGAINGGIFKREGVFKGPIVTIAVADIETALSKIEVAGGKKVRGKEPVGEMGWTAYFEDNQGNLMGLWQSKA